MSEDLEELTTFFTQVANFKYLIILFGLYNKSASWQNLITNILFNFSHGFVQADFHDILIHSKILKDHYSHIH